MLKRVLLFTTILFSTAALMMSNEGGLAHVQSLNYTGSTGGIVGCSNGGCHNGNLYQDSTYIRILDVHYNPVNCFMPGNTYVIQIKGKTNAPKWGFQMAASHEYNGGLISAGLLSSTPPYSDDVFVGNSSVVEQIQAIPALNGEIDEEVYWLAPTMPIADTVQFYYTILNINDDGSIDGDNFTHYVDTLGHWTPQTVSVNEPLGHKDDSKLKAYPNPFNNQLNVGLDNIPWGMYVLSVFDMSGHVVQRQLIDAGSSQQLALDASSWTAGRYHLLLNRDGFKKTVAVVKN